VDDTVLHRVDVLVPIVDADIVRVIPGVLETEIEPVTVDELVEVRELVVELDIVLVGRAVLVLITVLVILGVAVFDKDNFELRVILGQLVEVTDNVCVTDNFGGPLIVGVSVKLVV